MKKPKIITITNEKGGVGKTTTAVNMAAVLNNMGYKTLVLDVDRQANSTDTYQAQMEGVATAYDVLLESDENRIPLDEAIQHTELGDIVASDKLMEKSESVLSGNPNGNFRLIDAIEDSKNLGEYDFIIIDTPCVIQMLLYNCLIASDEVIIPISPSRYSISGLADLSRAITEVKKRQNRNLKIAGLLITMYERTNMAKDGIEALSDIADQIGTKVFDTKIRSTVRVEEAVAKRDAVVRYKPSCTASMDYYDFVEEYLKEEGVK